MSVAPEPGELVRRLEAERALPDGGEERFAGYGIMGLPFRSGHVLALRRFPASSIGPGYASVWHRDPQGNWTFHADVAPRLSCSRFFGSALASSERGAIVITWADPWRLTIAAPEARLTWEVRLAETPATRLLNGMAAALPAPLWRRPTVLAMMAGVAGRALGAGRIQLTGRSPNGQRFRANPSRMWVIAESQARLDGVNLGMPGALATQARLGDFLIPQRGLFVIGSAFFAHSGEDPSAAGEVSQP